MDALSTDGEVRILAAPSPKLKGRDMAMPALVGAKRNWMIAIKDE